MSLFLPPYLALRVQSRSEALQTSKAVQAQVGNITSLSAHHWQTVDTSTIYRPLWPNSGSQRLPYYPLTLSFRSPFLCFQATAWPFKLCVGSLHWCVGVHGHKSRTLLATEIFLEKTGLLLQSLSLSLSIPLSFLLLLCFSSITLITLLIGSCNTLETAERA